MSERFVTFRRKMPIFSPSLMGCSANTRALRGLFLKRREVELTEWYLAPQLFIVLERDGRLSPPALQTFDERTAEIKRIWTKRPAPAGLAARVVQELERRAVLAHSQILPDHRFSSAGSGQALSQPGLSAAVRS
jgi:hypothetical protein